MTSAEVPRARLRHRLPFRQLPARVFVSTRHKRRLADLALSKWFSTARAPLLVAAMLLGLTRADAQVSTSDGSAATLVIENDLFSSDGQDRNYSSGLKIAYLTSPNTEPGWARSLADLLPGYADRLDTRFEFELGQSMYTPRDLTLVVPDPNDRPYAGLLYASVGLISWTKENVLDQAQIVVGVVGPASQAGATQQWLHDNLSGAIQPKGWDSQIPNQLVGELRLHRSHRIEGFGSADGFEMDLAPTYGLSVGNLVTSADLGVGFRTGWHMPVDFGPPRVSPSLPGSGYFVTRHNSGFYLFGGLYGRYIAHSLVLDQRSAFGGGVERIPLVGDGQLGAAAYWGDLRLAYTQVWRTREFESQRSRFVQFGALSLSWRY